MNTDSQEERSLSSSPGRKLDNKGIAPYLFVKGEMDPDNEVSFT